MRVSFDFSAVNVIRTKSKSKPLALRSSQPILRDDVAVKPNAKGLTTLTLNATQAAAFNEAISTASGIVAIAKSGAIVLPDSHRGAPTVVGTSMADILAAAQAAEAATKPATKRTPKPATK